MAHRYGQYCPLALAVELLCERWTLLVVSRLIDGCKQFNEIHRGVPRISPSLLSRRLSELERAGLVKRGPARKGLPRSCTLTPAGQELAPIIDSLAVWGQRWSRDMKKEDLDIAFLAWSTHRNIDNERMPPGRTVIEFQFRNAPPDGKEFWLVHEHGTTDMCLESPGYDVDLQVRADLRLFIEAWRGIRDLRQEIRAGRVQVLGPNVLCKQFPSWLLLSGLAPHPRLRNGREHRLAAACGNA
jgi:DNA-binding HxlR family transcriptional regulator